MKNLSLLLTICLVFFLFPKIVYSAITLSVTNLPSSIQADQEFTADVDFVCSSCAASYLRGVFFYPDSISVYSGFTLNNSGEWVNTSGSPSSYFKIEEGSWNGQLKFKFDSEKPSGNYYFKIGRYTANGSSFSQATDPILINVLGSEITPTSTAEPTNTSTPTSTPTPTQSAQSIYKINKSKDTDGQTLSSVKIYVDGSYTHHEDDETLEFCDNCYCDTDKAVPCGLGEHTIKMVKNGYSEWSEQRNFFQGTFYEVTPVLSKNAETTATPTPTSTSTLTLTLTPTQTKTPTPKITISKPVSSDSAVLGESTSSASLSAEIITYHLDSTPSSSKIAAQSQFVNYKTPFFLGLFVAVSSGSWLYFRRRKD